MTTAERIVKLKALALTAKTAIYNEEAMTAIELAGVTACKVNECIEIVNQMIDTIEELSTDVDAIGVIVGYDIDNEELTVL